MHKIFKEDNHVRVIRLTIMDNDLLLLRDLKYDHILDGISLGEVGFPTLLHHARFNFGVVNRQDYFINEWSE